MKICSTCRETKSFSSFSKNRKMSDGYQNTCKSCQNKAEKSLGKVTKTEALAFIKREAESGRLYTCSCCGNEYKADSFYSIRRHGKVRVATSKCKECQKEYQRSKTFPDTSYDDLLKSQGGLCGICGINEVDYYQIHGKKFAIDHDHKTGKVRDLLCCKCNRGLGYFKRQSRVFNESCRIPSKVKI